MDPSKIILNKYTNLQNNPDAYTGVEKIYKQLKAEGHEWVNRDLVEKVLSSELSYYKHKYSRKPKKYAKVVAHGVDEIWQADTANVVKYSHSNKGYKHLLFVIDTVSKFLFVNPLKNLYGATIKEEFNDIIKTSDRKPGYLYTDAGTEFTNNLFQENLKDLHIHWYKTGSSTKSSLAERTIRTIKEKMYKHFTRTNQFKYIEDIKDIVDNYNQSVHSTTLFKPVVVTAKNEKEVLHNIYKDFKKPKLKDFKFDLGQTVVISRNLKEGFEKRYKGYFNTDIFVIQKIYRNKSVPMYKIRAKDTNETIRGAFYTSELQAVDVTPKKVKKRKRRKHYFY